LNICVDAQFAYPAGNQMGVLSTGVKNGDLRRSNGRTWLKCSRGGQD
jgi:hypothetical protein